MRPRRPGGHTQGPRPERKSGASAENGLALDELLEAELAQGQSTMSGLHTVSSKQFDVLSKAIAELKASQIELRAAALASASADAEADAAAADVVPPAEIQKSREYETVRASHDDDDDDDDDDDPIHARADEEHAS